MRDYTSTQPADCGSECAGKYHGDWPHFGAMNTSEQAKPRNDCANQNSYDVTK